VVRRDGQVVADSVTSNSYNDTGLTPITTYNYSVQAINQFGSSAESNYATGTTLETDPQPTGRGASMPYNIQQAENAATGGGASVLSPNREIGDLAGEASGRQAVTLNTNGAWVEFTTEIPTNTLVTRYSIPDAPGGGGLTASLNIYVDGQFEKAISLTSRHTWLYGNEDSPQNNPGAGGPRHIYDEANTMFNRVLPVGTKIRLQKDPDNQSQYAIDSK